MEYSENLEHVVEETQTRTSVSRATKATIYTIVLAVGVSILSGIGDAKVKPEDDIQGDCYKQNSECSKNAAKKKAKEKTPATYIGGACKTESGEKGTCQPENKCSGESVPSTNAFKTACAPAPKGVTCCVPQKNSRDDKKTEQPQAATATATTPIDEVAIKPTPLTPNAHPRNYGEKLGFFVAPGYHKAADRHRWFQDQIKEADGKGMYAMQARYEWDAMLFAVTTPMHLGYVTDNIIGLKNLAGVPLKNRRKARAADYLKEIVKRVYNNDKCELKKNVSYKDIAMLFLAYQDTDPLAKDVVKKARGELEEAVAFLIGSKDCRVDRKENRVYMISNISSVEAGAAGTCKEAYQSVGAAILEARTK